MKMTDLWNKYLKEDFPKKIETLLEIAKKDNILEEEINQEIRSNLNSFKLERQFIRKAQIIEEESSKLNSEVDKINMLMSALSIYEIALKFIEYLMRNNQSDYYKTRYDFVRSKIEIFKNESMCGIHCVAKSNLRSSHKKIQKRKLGEIIKDIEQILNPSIQNNSPSKDNPFKTFLDKNEKLITYNNLILQIQEKKTKIEILKNEIN